MSPLEQSFARIGVTFEPGGALDYANTTCTAFDSGMSPNQVLHAAAKNSPLTPDKHRAMIQLSVEHHCDRYERKASEMMGY